MSKVKVRYGGRVWGTHNSSSQNGAGWRFELNPSGERVSTPTEFESADDARLLIADQASRGLVVAGECEIVPVEAEAVKTPLRLS